MNIQSRAAWNSIPGFLASLNYFIFLYFLENTIYRYPTSFSKKYIFMCSQFSLSPYLYI